MENVIIILLYYDTALSIIVIIYSDWVRPRHRLGTNKQIFYWVENN